MIQEYHPRWSSFIVTQTGVPTKVRAKVGDTMYIDTPLKCNIGPWKDALLKQQVAFQSLSFWGVLCFLNRCKVVHLFLCALQSMNI